MDKITNVLSEVLPAIESWLRNTVRDEMERTLAADHQKQKPTVQYSREETANMLGISKVTLWEMEKKGKIKATRIGRRVLFDESEIKRILNK